MPILTSAANDPPFEVVVDVPGGMVYLTFDGGAYGRYLTQAEVIDLIRELRRAIGLEGAT